MRSCRPSCLVVASVLLVSGLAPKIQPTDAPVAAAEKPLALPRSTPEEQGVSSPALLEFIEAADRDIDQMHSFMLVRHGHVTAEGWWGPYDAQTAHILYSLSKSFTST